VSKCISEGLQNNLINVVAFGGSVTAGHGVGVNGSTYVVQFSRWRESTTNVSVVPHNLGIPGTSATFPSVCVSEMLRNVSKSSATIVFVEFSINGSPKSDLRRLIQSLEYMDSVVVFYVDTFNKLFSQRQFSAWKNDTRNELPAHFGGENAFALTELNLTSFSLGKAFHNADDQLKTFMTDQVFYEDDIHLTSTGHSVFAEVAASYIAGILHGLPTYGGSVTAAARSSNKLLSFPYAHVIVY
jgi:hypothetical protein